MTYQQTIDYLFNQLANYQKNGAKAYKPGLNNIITLLNKLNNPQNSIKTIHLAGTNGKGSTSHILASILIENGYKVGLFTSPHIKDFRERIKINGQLVAKQLIVDFVMANKSNFDNLNPSFFEITTAMAFSFFKKQNCDIAIIETGLGGRLDSTNTIKPEVSIITNISIDHTNFLGTTVAQIAKEKAGIIKAKTPVVIGEFNNLSMPIFKAEAKAKSSNLTIVNHKQTYKTDLLGGYQQKNIATALAAIKILKQKGWFIDDLKTTIALTKVKRNTNLFGRLEQIDTNPKVLIDACHNFEGVKNLFKELSKIKHKNLHCVYATSSDKDVNDILTLFPKNNHYYFTTFQSKRSLPLNKLNELALKNKLNFKTFNDPKQALQTAKQCANKNDLIVVFGSFFLLEKII